MKQTNDSLKKFIPIHVVYEFIYIASFQISIKFIHYQNIYQKLGAIKILLTARSVEFKIKLNKK